MKYSLSHFSYQRVPSLEVKIGDLALGGNNPIRIQSMTTTNTMDTLATVEQSIRMIEAGCELVRITAPSKKEAENLANIKAELRKRGYNTPLVADIHFTPNAAEVAARLVEKVRVNPGNYADKKKFEQLEYTDTEYTAEIERIYERFAPLVKICKEYGTAMRIGTNHGSLSDRIMSRYGDSPLGMVESALEFMRICEDFNYHNLVISMKASNPQVMVQAYRLLAEKMLQNGNFYPLHLGVTEAGDGEDGRIKSALGIATLLMDGLGDTIRVSLTEEPEHEMPVGKFLADLYEKQQAAAPLAKEAQESIALPFDPYAFAHRHSRETLNVGGRQVPRVVCDLRHACTQAADLQAAGYTYLPALDKYNFSDTAADFVFLGKNVPAYELPGGLKAIYDHATWRLLRQNERSFPYFDTWQAFADAAEKHSQLNFVEISEAEIATIEANAPLAQAVCFVLNAPDTYALRRMIYRLTNAGIEAPLMPKLARPASYPFYNDAHIAENVRMSEEAKLQIALAAEGSTLLVDGLIEGVWLASADSEMLRTAFNMLQLSRLRITKTEYISCPSCGRTLFDLQETTARIRKRTEHLKGVKIGIMGCIVNGPGEMADADYGYVGVGPDKIALYRGKEVVVKSVHPDNAVDALIGLIQEDGVWVEGV